MEQTIPAYRNRQLQLAFPMNSVLRRSLRLPTSSVRQRQPRTSKAFRQITHPHICGRAGWRQYSTHNPDGFKDKSAVGVSHPHNSPPFAALLNALPECRCLPLRPQLSSFSPVPVSIFTLDRKSNGCKSKSVSPSVSSLPFGYVLKTWSRKGDGVTLCWSCSRRWAV